MAAKRSPHTMNHELLKAVSTDDADLLAQILGVWSSATAEGGDESCLRGVTAEGSSALHIAASRGYLTLVVLICTQDTSLIISRNNLLDTPLICAARAGRVDVVNYFIKHEARHPQHVLEEVPVSPILKAWNSGGVTAMHEAIRNGHVSVLRKLVSRDSRLLAVVDGQGVSPLYLAVVSNQDDMVGILIRESSDAQEMCESLLHWEPTLAEKADASGRTALHYAASAGKAKVVNLLLANDSSSAYISDDNGLFPVHVAAIAGNIEVVCELTRICPGCVEFVDNKHRNILHCAVEHGRVSVVWRIQRNPKFVSMMNAGNSEGDTPLHLAVKHGHVIIFTLLMMDLRVNLSNINHEGLTPRHVAFAESYSFLSFKKIFISACLLCCDAYPSPFYQPRNMTDKQCLEDEKEASVQYTNVSQSILSISAFVAAGSFDADFAPPRGHDTEGDKAGMSMAMLNAHFGKVAANSMSFYFSIFATCLLVVASQTTTPIRVRRFFLSLSAVLVCLAVINMIIAFASIVFVAMASKYPWNSWDEYLLELNGDELFVLFLNSVAVVVPMYLLLLPVSVLVVVQFLDDETVQPGQQKPCSGPGSVGQGDAKFLHPT
ncbi:protein ACCELERATED CELL DEATH 6-like [Panicum miliaceum]|uniref:Protein ACCELERATED CELL DEATH 6-like n=1 Tax=Panicum miliaceum TaxID=4540 RepID=A0A3L6R882_PANMI|nr:protein ACCELERATED CELL DEATH 6-like [Panicum miliaceum]